MPIIISHWRPEGQKRHSCRACPSPTPPPLFCPLTLVKDRHKSGLLGRRFSTQTQAWPHPGIAVIAGPGVNAVPTRMPAKIRPGPILMT